VPVAPGGAAATAGFHLPTTAETGLSSLPVSALIQNIMKWLLYIVGFVAIIAFVISGMQYLLAAGSEDMAKKAKANMQYAMLGVLVALSALIVIRAIQSVLQGSWFF
jgi:TRAP-type C4-dicarboxylate transport system permease small subunit